MSSSTRAHIRSHSSEAHREVGTHPRVAAFFAVLVMATGIGIVLTGCQPTAEAPDRAGQALEATRTPEPSDLPKYSFTDDGALMRPTGYRRWVYVGTPVTPNELNPPEAPFPEFHNVYIHPDDFEHWERHGRFQDGTILVKELVGVRATEHVSGKGYFMGEFTGLEATIKDSRRFADEPGNWAYFSFGHSYPLEDTATAFPAQACNSCHDANAADDWVFTQDYPVLRAAKGG